MMSDIYGQPRTEQVNSGVVIVTYNRLELLKECLAHVLDQEIPFSRIVVVDNCSTDGTDEYLAGLEKNEGFTVIHEKENLGGAGGFYDGMEEISKYHLDWVLIIDDDAMISKDYMRRLCAYAKEHPQVNALSGTVYVDDKIHTMHRRRITSRLLFMEGNVPESEYEQRAFHCDCATFCGLLVKGSVMDTIGLPKKEYFIWYDDSEYSLRLMSYGGIVNVSAARLDHKTTIPRETEGLLERTSWRHYYGYRNRYDTARIHLGTLSAMCIALEYHVLRFLSCLMMLNRNTRDKGRFNVEMIHDALSDARKHRLGKNPKYLPG